MLALWWLLQHSVLRHRSSIWCLHIGQNDHVICKNPTYWCMMYLGPLNYKLPGSALQNPLRWYAMNSGSLMECLLTFMRPRWSRLMSVVLFLDSLLIAAPIVCGFFYVWSLFCNVIGVLHLAEKKMAGSFTFELFYCWHVAVSVQSTAWYRELVCGLWLWHFLVILTINFRSLIGN